MKFVCDNCKAKYQIGDDKVSGKTVRMKCRRCGHLILVSAAVTESSVSRALPAEGAPLGGAPAASSSLAPDPAAPGAAPLRRSPTLDQMPLAELSEDEDGATMIMRMPPQVRPAAPVRPSTGGLRVPAAPRSGAAATGDASAAPTAPARPAPPKPGVPRASGSGPTGAVGGAAGLTPQPAPSAPSLGDLAQRSAISAAARSSSNPLGPVRPTPTPPSVAPRSPSVVPASGASGGPSGGGVAGAFQRAVVGTQPVLRAETPGEDWYVGVGGVPLGPVRLSVIREKLEQGAVDGDSLVWREGFDEWLPLRNVPGLRAILDERRSVAVPEGGRITSSSVPRVAAPTPVPGQLQVGGASLPPSAGLAANGAASGHGALALGNVPTGGVALGPATASPAAHGLGAVDGAQLPGAGLLGASPEMAERVSLAAAPVVAPLVAPAPASLPPPSRTERKGMHPFAYAMIAMAAVFGGVAALVLLKPAPPPVFVVQTVAAGPDLPAAPPPPPTTTADAPPETAGSAEMKSGDPRVASAGGTRPTASAPTRPGDPPPNSGSFDQGVGGPTAGPGKDGAGSARGQLSEGEINGVVSRNMAGVRRRCWQPALDARAASAPKSARVSTTITISASGSVSSASASGSEQHFPGLASCIGGAIRGWQFPPSEGPTTVNIPFSFNAQ